MRVLTGIRHALTIVFAAVAIVLAAVALPAAAQDPAANVDEQEDDLSKVFKKNSLWLVQANHTGDDPLHLRAAPKNDAEVLLSLSPNAFHLRSTGEVKRVGKQRWARIEYSGVTGWIPARKLLAQDAIPLDALALFAMGISVKFHDYTFTDLHPPNVPKGFAPDDPQHPNRCPFGRKNYVLSFSDAFLRHFEKQGFSLRTLCMVASAPIRFDPETGQRLPIVSAGWLDELILLNIPICFKNGTSFLDCQNDYHFYYEERRSNKDRLERRMHYKRWGHQVDKAIKEALARGELKEGIVEGSVIEDLARQAWKGRHYLQELSFCDISKVYPRGYACALMVVIEKGNDGDDEPLPAAAKVWRDDGSSHSCVKDKTCSATSIFFGTVRSIDPSPIKLSFNEKRGGKLLLGRAIVTVPAVPRKKGTLLRPSWADALAFRNPFQEDPRLHFTIPPSGLVIYPDEAAFMAAAKRNLPFISHKDHALVFIHGYNVTFDQALFRLAQLSHDLGENGQPFGSAFLFSWPSGGRVADYLYDSDSARSETSVNALVSFLELVAAKSGAKHVHVIAHSMGNVVALQAFDRLASQKRDGNFAQIIFAAPDVDKQDFEAIAKRITPIAKGFTLYASSNDAALMASKGLRRDLPRAGDVTSEGPVVVDGIDTIDVSLLSTEFFSLKHSDYAEQTSLLTDIGKLLRSGIRPPDMRSGVFVAKQLSTGTYWRAASSP